MKKLWRSLVTRCLLSGSLTLFINACAPNNSAPNLSSAPRNEQTTNSQNNTVSLNGQSADNRNASATTPQRSMGDPIDTSKYDETIKSIEAKLKRRSTDANLKKELSQAFAARADALTDARQYSSALGDYRRALKLDESNQRAKESADLIASIYVSMNREVPPEGTEPPPLPYNSNDDGKTSNGNINNGSRRLVLPGKPPAH